MPMSGIYKYVAMCGKEYFAFVTLSRILNQGDYFGLSDITNAKKARVSMRQKTATRQKELRSE